MYFFSASCTAGRKTLSTLSRTPSHDPSHACSTILIASLIETLPTHEMKSIMLPDFWHPKQKNSQTPVLLFSDREGLESEWSMHEALYSLAPSLRHFSRDRYSRSTLGCFLS